ncbi:MAG: L-threonine 3-dehydrogenase [Elusimicrobia bacterium]|nr:L-threonine 3-dehydrogenase [Elusimicrobiota bacterium]
MKALVKKSAAPGAEFGDAAAPRPKQDELLIKVHRASICGSDMPIYGWTSWAPERLKLPLVFGHEFCGTVESAGAAAGDFKAGDFVSVESHIYCGRCEQCVGGQSHVCREMKIMGIDAPGGFAQYAVIPARCAWKHADERLKDWGSIMEPMGNAVYSVLVEPVAGKTVLVLGAGPQGLFAVAVARASGARAVVAVEGSPFRAELARRMGAKAVVDPAGTDPLAAALKAGGCPGGFDAVVEMSGAAQAISMGLKAARPGGRMTAFGLPSKKIEIDWASDVIFKGLRIHGIVGREVFGTWRMTEALLRSGAVDAGAVITHVFPMKDFARAFGEMAAPEKKCGKVVLVP